MNLNLFITQNGDGNVSNIDSGEHAEQLIEIVKKMQKEIQILKDVAQVYLNKPENKIELIPLTFEQLN